MKGKVAMITGASVGIGRAVALRLAEEGAKLVLFDLNTEKLNETAKEVKSLGCECLTFVCDVSDEKAVNQAVKQALDAFARIDILVNNAAIWRMWEPFLETSVEKWKKFIDVNVMSVVYCTRAVLPNMIDNNYGRIVNVASVAGVYGNANMVAYSATKGALIAITKSLAKEVVDKGIVVNSVSPGTVSPSSNADIDSYQQTDKCYVGRTGTNRENANLIYWLVSDQVGCVAGQNIQIDGCRRYI